MLMTRDEIARLIPHSGNMCLLDSVLAFDAEHIVCTATSHTDSANPLRSQGRLGAVCGVEYAAQAMALHGGLREHSTQPTRPRAGYLASVRSIQVHTDCLDTHPQALRIEAHRQSGDDTRVLYAFSVHAGATLLLEGRAAVVLDADKLIG
jgi:predicted hotdog family 3-hydroxylacyl-ACP dehydratase